MEETEIVKEKLRLRELSFNLSPKVKEVNNMNQLLSLDERFKEADIIYEWLIKYL